mmetsp:Transcript_71249/g.204392  ORF Transcript_71249/g.204392 Transcript_71249/m.204392 type:complete len:412 (+) Transcript_71249:2265-3500(+)
MALAGHEIVLVVRRGDLDASGAEFAVHHGVRDHDHLAVREEGVHQFLADELQVPVVLRVDGHRGVAQHRLDTCRGHHEEVVGALDLVLELAKHPHLDLLVVAWNFQVRDAWDLLVVHLQVRECRAQVRAPIHQSVVPVDQALIVEADERLDHGLVQQRVHGEALARPVGARGDLVELVLDVAGVLVLPRPDSLQELLAAQVVARQLLVLVEQFLHDALRGDAGVVQAREPQREVAAHPVPPRQRILNGAGQGVPNVQRARDVRRRDDHDEFLGLASALAGLGVRREVFLFLPPSRPRGLDVPRVVGGGDGKAQVLLLALRRLNKRHRFHGFRLGLCSCILLRFAFAGSTPRGLVLHGLGLLLLFVLLPVGRVRRSGTTRRRGACGLAGSSALEGREQLVELQGDHGSVVGA